MSATYEPRCRTWYTSAIDKPGLTISLSPYLDSESKSIVTTFSKAFVGVPNSFLKRPLTFVSCVDFDLDLETFEKALRTMQGFDHFFLLDMKENVFMHSSVPFILREGIPIENIEFGVTQKQIDRNDDVVPKGEIKNNETEFFKGIVTGRLK